MHIPRKFHEQDESRLLALMETHGFATLVTLKDGVPLASHLPFLVERDPEGRPRLLSHMARVNPQWQTFAQTPEVLTIFQGPHAYVSASCYVVPTVPTWNYAVVHAYGSARIVEEPGEILPSLKRLTTRHEAGNEHPWNPDEAEPLIHRLMAGIVAFEISITRLEGAFKLSQNRNEQEQRNVIQFLDRDAHPGGREVAALMKSLRTRD